MTEATIAVCAAPNTGKTTLFNRLTGSNQSVGNWPGVTVEKKTGRRRLDGYDVLFVDLPGVYSLTPSSEGERITRDYLWDSPPDAILNVLDAGNLYRGLGFTLQLAMTGLPMVVAVSMMDEAHAKGIEIDFERISEHLGLPTVPIVARTGEGMPDLEATLLAVLQGKSTQHPPHISFPPVLEQAISDLAREVEATDEQSGLDHVFVAASLMEDADAAVHLTRRSPALKRLVSEAAANRRKVEKRLAVDLPIACAECRFNAARGLVREAVRMPPSLSASATERLDRLLMHRWLGLPLFLLIMLGLFQAMFALGTPLQTRLAAGIQAIQAWLWVQPALGALPPLVQSFLVEGLLAGLGVVVSFLPIILLFFVMLSLVEDSGYMARAAFLMDRLMHTLRLDGKAFISLLLGYGCNVPAVLGTRILSSRHSRVLAMLLVPFSLCSGRLQVFVFISGILFAPRSAPWVVFSLYILSFGIIFLAGLLLRPFRFGTPAPFIMELPPYRRPMVSTVTLRAAQELRDFLHRAATVIVIGVVAVWFLTHYPPDVPAGSPDSLAGRTGLFLAPAFSPIGIHWAETVALFFGFIAKEILIGALAVVYGAPDLAAAIRAEVTPLQGLSFMVFTLIYTPCVATLAAIWSESRSWRVALLSMLLGVGLAWLVSFIVYQGGLWLGYT
jgi:ferrous iron transport protein B